MTFCMLQKLNRAFLTTVVFDRANEKSALLVTGDKDFGEIVFRDNRLSSRGVVLLRLAGYQPKRKPKLFQRLFKFTEQNFQIILASLRQVKSEFEKRVARENNAAPNNSMNVRAKHGRCIVCQLARCFAHIISVVRRFVLVKKSRSCERQ